MTAFAHQEEVHHHASDSTADEEYRYYVDLTKKPDAIKAVWLGVICPGAGQIYNKAYWKLPIVYGAFMGCGYAISMMQNRYTGYKTAYIDLYNDIQAGTVTEDASKSYIAVIPDGYDLTRVGGASRWQSTLKNQTDIYRRYRDYSILATVIVYALSLIDAYVDAQLFDPFPRRAAFQRSLETRIFPSRSPSITSSLRLRVDIRNKRRDLVHAL